mmetsp:Transcript_14227/g.18628  ORF Transcript_14227/g.18628 Transcript_14227/m.18628 type:complete len:541 (-) Transcript_14227:344-1966(-)|eukprot:CAMPEP_0117743036 /NCGR_PEP_ID=MMETSP0947-20121206/5888_1 /TAXON_ID=44440 /ORGANISM="Chattonella subsalsa, Strain CCMP2191" /LENGTH=540 /DNA_ID=CAMNT_0005559645 /DNA_START=141 /DNA_END=1763 /DNA_ORIENTATION=+
MFHTSQSIDIRVHGAIKDESYTSILTPDALRFLGHLAINFEDKRQALLKLRVARQLEFDSGLFPNFCPETAAIRDGDWKVLPPPADLLDRRVEITGPVDRKMVINGLNSGANTYMADFEDSSAPTWETMVEGQVNLRDAVQGTIEYVNPANGKVYRPKEKTAVLLCRPRGWHLDEAHVTVNGRPMSGSLFDFGLYFFHNCFNLLKQGSGPYFYVPKLENRLEARLWNDVFCAAQDYMGVPRGTIKATILLETITAAFEMNEMLYEMREHSIGMNCGRWDYIFSYIKKFKSNPDCILPDRNLVGMTTPFLEAYVKQVIYTCHRRGTFAMGGMAAQIPVKNDPETNNRAMAAVRADKEREARNGHDGTWVAHPALVSIAKEAFDAVMPTPNQISKLPEEFAHVTAEDLVAAPHGLPMTLEALRENIGVCLQYTEAWLRGTGCIPVHNKMEDAATAEISRVQVWQWMYHGVETSEGQKVTKALINDILTDEVNKALSLHGCQNRKFMVAGKLLQRMLTGDTLDEFLTSVAYNHIVNFNSPSKL